MTRLSRAMVGLGLLLSNTYVMAGCPKPEFVGKTRMYILEQDGVETMVPAVVGSETATEFYDYRSHSSHTGLEEKDNAVMFIYQNMNDDSKLSFFTLLGIEHGTQGAKEFQMLISQVPDGVAISDKDDPHEVAWTGASLPFSNNWKTVPASPKDNVGGKFWFKDNTDGLSIDNLPTDDDADWKLKIETNKKSMVVLKFKYGDGSGSRILDFSKPMYLGPVTVDSDKKAPYPAAGETSTFCVMASDGNNGGNWVYTFDFGDGSAPVTVTKANNVPACVEHTFCPSGTCGGSWPRKVEVEAEREAGGCGKKTKKVLAKEPCPAVDVLVNGKSLKTKKVESSEVRTKDGKPNYTSIPEKLVGTKLFLFGDASLPRNSNVQLRCCPKNQDVCSYAISVYHCPPCSLRLNGGFPETLPRAGWAVRKCGPLIDHSQGELRTTTFRMDLQPGDVVDLPDNAKEALGITIFAQEGALPDSLCSSRGVFTGPSSGSGGGGRPGKPSCICPEPQVG